MRTVSVVLVLLMGVVMRQEPRLEAHGTVSEVMIGILSPSSEIVGQAAFLDPAAPSDEAGFDPYAGWQKVEAAAIAMAESANLLTIPGRLCSTGQPAPIDQTDWIEWVEDLRALGMSSYAAAQSKSQDTLIELSDGIAASCSDCHARYLDVGGDPTNRCMP